jgi:hypothetical protein
MEEVIMLLKKKYTGNEVALRVFVRIPGQVDQSFRSKSSTDSGAFRPVIPL